MLIKSIKTGIEYNKIESEILTESEKQMIKNDVINGLGIYDKICTASQIKNALTNCKKMFGGMFKWFLIDYFTLLNLDTKNPVEGYTKAAQIIQKCCHELQLTGIVLSQVNENDELAWCKELFRAAFFVCRIHMDDPYSNNRTVYVDKHKTGQKKKIAVEIDGATSTLYFGREQ
jgi:hypothetical protein